MKEIMEKYETLFALRKQSLELFKKAAREIKTNRLDFSELKQLCNIEDRFKNKKNNFWFLKHDKRYYINNHNVREVARYLLVVHFLDKLDYSDLLAMFDSPDQEIRTIVWERLNLLDKDKHDYQALLDVYTNKGDVSEQTDIEDLLIKYFPEKLREDQALLIKIFGSKNLDNRNKSRSMLVELGSTKLNLKISLAALESGSSYYRDNVKLLLMEIFGKSLGWKLLFMFLNTMDSRVENGVESLLKEFDGNELDYDVLLELSNSDHYYTRHYAIRLLLDKFDHRLGRKELVGFLCKFEREIKDEIISRLLDRFADVLGCEDLFICLAETKIYQIFVKLQKLTRMLPVQKINKVTLVQYSKSEEGYARHEAQYLLVMHFLEDLEYSTLLSFLENGESEVVDKIWQRLDAMDAGTFNRNVLYGFLDSENWEIKAGAKKLLERIESNEAASLDNMCHNAIMSFNS